MVWLGLYQPYHFGRTSRTASSGPGIALCYVSFLTLMLSSAVSFVTATLMWCCPLLIHAYIHIHTKHTSRYTHTHYAHIVCMDAYQDFYDSNKHAFVAFALTYKITSKMTEYIPFLCIQNQKSWYA